MTTIDELEKHMESWKLVLQAYHDFRHKKFEAKTSKEMSQYGFEIEGHSALYHYFEQSGVYVNCIVDVQELHVYIIGELGATENLDNWVVDLESGEMKQI